MRPVLLSILLAGIAAGAEPAPMSMLNKSIDFIPPDGWEVVKSSNEEFVFKNGETTMMNIIALPAALQLTENYGSFVIKQYRENAAKTKDKISLGPRVEPDKRFPLRIRMIRAVEGKDRDQVSLFRVINGRIFEVCCNCLADDKDLALRVKDAEDMLLSVNRAGQARRPEGSGSASGTTPATSPVVHTVAPVSRPAPVAAATRSSSMTLSANTTLFTKPKLTLLPPAGWTELVVNVDSGTIATYRDPQDRSRIIVVSIRPSAAVDLVHDESRAAAIAEFVTAEKTSLKLDGAKLTSGPKKSLASGLTHKARYTYDISGRIAVVETRQALVGDYVVSVGSICGEADAEPISALADRVAMGVKPVNVHFRP